MSSQQNNTEQRDAWNGVMGQSWSLYQDSLDAMMLPLTTKLIAAAQIAPGDHVLDIGCGCGPTTLAIAEVAGARGHATGIDISKLLLQSARERSAALKYPVSWIEADAATYAFKERYDKIVSRFGVMFFSDPSSAFENIRSALKPNGAVTFICWRRFEDNPWIAEVMAEVAKIMPLPPRPAGYMPGPFAFGHRAFVESVLRKAGFDRLEMDAFDMALPMPGKTLDERADFYARMGPLAAMMRESDDSRRAQLRDLMRAWLERRIAAGRATQDSACWLVKAR